MTPIEFYNSYKSMSVSFDMQTFSGIAAKKYVINYEGGMKLVKEIDLELGKIKSAGMKLLKSSPEVFALNTLVKIDHTAFSRTIYGKGSPTEMEHVLKIALITGVLPANHQKLREFAANYFGTDCTGFVCSYFRTLGKMPTNVDPLLTGCSYFLSKAKEMNNLIWNPLEIVQGDIVLWMDETGKETRSPGHIAIINSIESPLTLELDVKDKELNYKMRLNCVESNGAKPGEDPRTTLRLLGELKGEQRFHNRYWTLKSPFTGKEGKVIIVRPFGQN